MPKTVLAGVMLQASFAIFMALIATLNDERVREKTTWEGAKKHVNPNAETSGRIPSCLVQTTSVRRRQLCRWLRRFTLGNDHPLLRSLPNSHKAISIGTSHQHEVFLESLNVTNDRLPLLLAAMRYSCAFPSADPRPPYYQLPHIVGTTEGG